MPTIAGFKAAVAINGANYNVAEIGIDQTVEDLDVTNSEGASGDANAVVDETYPAAFQAAVAGPRIARVNFKSATFDVENNPFLTPFTFFEGDYINAEVVPDRADGDVKWVFPSLLVTEIKYEQTARGLQPISISARTNGKYFPPGQIAP
jgi:hypothetical protein